VIEALQEALSRGDEEFSPCYLDGYRLGGGVKQLNVHLSWRGVNVVGWRSHRFRAIFFFGVTVRVGRGRTEKADVSPCIRRFSTVGALLFRHRVGLDSGFRPHVFYLSQQISKLCLNSIKSIRPLPRTFGTEETAK